MIAAAKSLQSCPTLCDPIDGSPLGSSVPGILQARILEWVAISFSNAWKWKVKVKSLSRARLLATPWTAAYQAPPSMGFSRQEYWSGLPLPSPIMCLHLSYSKRKKKKFRQFIIYIQWAWKKIAKIKQRTGQKENECRKIRLSQKWYYHKASCKNLDRFLEKEPKFASKFSSSQCKEGN